MLEFLLLEIGSFRAVVYKKGSVFILNELSLVNNNIFSYILYCIVICIGFPRWIACSGSYIIVYIILKTSCVYCNLQIEKFPAKLLT